MGPTSYFKERLPRATHDGHPDNAAPRNKVEIYASSSSGVQMLYLKHIDGDGNEVDSVLSEESAKRILDGLERAAYYLGYRRQL